MDIRGDISLTARKLGSRPSRGGTIVTAVAPLTTRLNDDVTPRAAAFVTRHSTDEGCRGERANGHMNTLKAGNHDRVVPYLWRIRAQFFN